ncbi:NAD(P)/FAD-dependent oxidoreductase [Peptostreptococcus canis]|uniref:Aminoacetone oxidase family FAD-binding enzyme n=1 Tax=Peptostreptococcus canis TaxID=1159213 RepID=A0ABR6TJU3_9FIRM|nr:aminoacetone oxidase family FAD-binding enzyme [Peptostreptococcus canis]MBC2575684.1 aminoacetone oxidase family FAD-binding enzyme [Peptostreptococcus canis]MBP1998965.1 putative Rossmann fold flavoprotein [Peptostreptococcus canis]
MKKREKRYNIAIVGGGPAGIFAAISAKKHNNKISVCIIESNKEICRKLQMTGGGRCNFTNNKDISMFFDNVVNNSKFLYSSFYSFTNNDLMKFIKSVLGLEYVVEINNHDKVYLKSGKSQDLINELESYIKKCGIDVYYNSKVDNIVDGEVKRVYTKENIFNVDKIIISTGGVSYKNTGSDGVMLSIMNELGHNIVDTKPALVPIIIKENWTKLIPGVSLKNINLHIFRNNKRKKKICSIKDDIVFTHKGIGGPAALKASSYLNKSIDEFFLIVDFIPDISNEDIRNMITNDNKKTVLSSFKKIFPNNFAKSLLNYCSKTVDYDVDFINAKCCNLTNKHIDLLILAIKECHFTPEKLESIDKATITSGGINVKNINPSTLESNVIAGIYFSGEVIDVDALTGGYNLQIAFSTGYLAGLSAAESM